MLPWHSGHCGLGPAPLPPPPPHVSAPAARGLSWLVAPEARGWGARRSQLRSAPSSGRRAKFMSVVK